ncbi:DUF993 family protein [Brachybacterium sp. AOP25-B2-12]|uniref:DUF993 family protein n=1 Tax=Brachybacterium sp. AOP25-B2-12 TaxID=3457710 RepID=UPI0040334D96
MTTDTRTTITVPTAEGLRRLQVPEPGRLVTSTAPSRSRVVYAASHVIPVAATASTASSEIDWEATLALRHRLWDLGLGVAESMDTAQRGMGLSAAMALELGERTLAEASSRGGAVVVGIGTDQLGETAVTLQDIIGAYLAQIERIEDAGGSVVMMASRHLARTARSADDYLRVYGAVLDGARRPVVLHWLGQMFDPALEGYWGSRDLDAAADTVLELIGSHRGAIAGIKMSLLDAAREVAVRQRLPAGVRMFTGDDFHYAELIAGDEQGHSDALLGAFAAIPRFASAALARLDAGDVDGFRAILDPTVPLSRLVFESPTRFYKVGVSWLGYLSGDQGHTRMLGGLETGRSPEHLGRLLSEGLRIGLFEDPELAASRAGAWFRGIGL